MSRWRAGETVPEKEQSSVRQLTSLTSLSADDSLSRRAFSPSLATPNTTPSLSPTPFATPTPGEARAFEEERTKLYQQLDEKVQ